MSLSQQGRVAIDPRFRCPRCFRWVTRNVDRQLRKHKCYDSERHVRAVGYARRRALGETLQEIGDSEGCTPERVRQVIEEAGIPRVPTRQLDNRLRQHIERLRSIVYPPVRQQDTHGTLACYSNGGCRCDECREAHTIYRRAQRRATGKRSSFGHACETCGLVVYYAAHGWRHVRAQGHLPVPLKLAEPITPENPTTDRVLPVAL
jgi:hypothetical protein